MTAYKPQSLLRQKLVSSACRRKLRCDVSKTTVSSRTRIWGKDKGRLRPSLDRDPPAPRPGTPEHAKWNPGPPQGDFHQQASHVPCGGCRFLHQDLCSSPRTQLGTGPPLPLLPQQSEKYSTALSRAEPKWGQRGTDTCVHASQKVDVCV